MVPYVSEQVKKELKKDYLNRLDLVKEAINDEISKLGAANSQAYVGIVTFSDRFQILGDCSQGAKAVQLPYINLQSWDEIVNAVNNKHQDYFTKNIQEAYDQVKQQVRSLKTYGSTALGPGLLASVALASQGKPGSKVIICTDGMANIGVGSIGYNNREGEKFYDDVGAFAQNKGVSISVVTIKGDAGCSIKNLGKASNATNGMISRVDPVKIGTEFSKVINEEIIGSNVHLTIRMNRVFSLRGVDPKLLKDDGSLYEAQQGNFTVDTEFKYDFDIKELDDVVGKYDISLKLFEKAKLPMQIQIVYTGRNGNRYLSIFTDWRVMGSGEDEVLDEMELGTFLGRGEQKIALLIQKQHYLEAQRTVDSYL